jgi:hypothetical protein
LSLALLAGLSGRAEAGLLFAADGQNGNPNTNLYIIDPTSGAVEKTVGPIGFAVVGMAFDPLNGVLYGATAPKGSSKRDLITINITTGAGTLVGSFGGPGMTDIAFGQDGTLYGWSDRLSASSLYTINLTTGVATKVSTSGLTDNGAGFTISNAGTAYLADAGASGVLRTVNLTTGLTTDGATLSGAPSTVGSIHALSFDSSGNLFGINLADGGPHTPGSPPDNAFLVAINPTTGAVTNVGQTVSGLDAFAFQIPEPAALVQAGLGVLTAVGYGWSRRRPGAGKS